MNHQQSLSLGLKELWQESPRWQNLVLAALVCTVMAVAFHPAGNGGPANSYTPPSQTSQPTAASGPVVPPKAGAAASVPSPPPPDSGQTLSVVPPAAPAPIKIKPSQSLDNIEVETGPQVDRNANFGRATGTWTIKPIAPADSVEVEALPQANRDDDFGRPTSDWGIKPISPVVEE